LFEEKHMRRKKSEVSPQNTSEQVVPNQPTESAPQISLSREDLASAIKADYAYVEALGRLTTKARIRIGVKIVEYAKRFHAGKVAPAARELAINEKSASEWVSFARRYRDVAEDKLPETRDEARKGREARTYRKTGAYSRKGKGREKPVSGAVLNGNLESATPGVPQKKSRNKGGHPESVLEINQGSGAENDEPDERTEEQKGQEWIDDMKTNLAAIASELAAAIGWGPVFHLLEETRGKDQQAVFEEV
jgi:hypothetical protein